MPQEVSRVRQVLIRRVVHVRDPVIGGPGPELLPVDVEKRSDDRPVSGVDARQPAGPGAPQQPQQHSFGLVVARVPDGDPVGPERLPAPLQGGVPELPGGVLNRASFRGRHTPDLNAFDMGGNAQPTRQRLAERLIALRVRPAQLVVDVHQARYGELASRRELQEHAEQRYRIGPPDTATATRVPAGSRSYRRIARQTPSIGLIVL